jgi:branched-chain amino acid transport system substrate-binding protein
MHRLFSIFRFLPLGLSAATLICLAFSGCKEPEPIRIGFVAGISGRVADLGISGCDAVQMAVEECNRNGGIRGRRVQLLVKDDQQDPETARLAAADLIRQGVVAIVGPMTSDMALAAAPLVNESEILAVSPTATTQRLSGRDDFFFRVTGTTRDYASRSARFQIESGGIRRIAAIYDIGNRSFTEEWLDEFRKVFVSLGGEIVARIAFRAEEGRNFLEIAAEALTAGPDGVLIVANSMDSAVLCQQIRKIDSRIQITLADWGATERLLELGGKAVEGVTVVQTFDRENGSVPYRTFRDTYLERYGREPGFPGVHAYDAVRVVLEALRLRGEGRGLRETVRSQGRFEGLQKPIEFDEFGDVNDAYASISIVHNGTFVVLE